MRGTASLVFAPPCVPVLLPGTLASLAAHNAWFTRGLPGYQDQTLDIDPAVSHRPYLGTDWGRSLAHVAGANGPRFQLRCSECYRRGILLRCENPLG